MSIDYASARWGGDAHPPCLIDTIVATAGRYPDRPALVVEGLTLSYSELLAWAGQLADDLDRAGSRRGEPVGIACPRGAEAVAAMVAVVLSGRAYVPLDLEYPRLRLEHMLLDSGVTVVLASGPRFDLSTSAVVLPLGVPQAGAAHRPAPVDRTPLPGAADGAAPDWVGRHESDLPGYIIYTSGSTGWPKGVVLPHSCLDNVVQWQAAVSPAPDLRTAQFAPLNFDVSFQEIFGTLGGGGTLLVPPESLRRDPAGLLAWLAENQVQRLFLPYVALQMMAVAAAYGAPVAGLALLEVNVAGEQLLCTEDIRAFFRRVPGCRLVNHYGQSESAMVSYHVLDRDPDRWPVLAPIGVPLPGCELVVDRDDSGDGTGELLVGGLPVSLGYLNQPELNRRRYLDVAPTRHGCTRLFRTGDLVRFEDDAMRFLNRLDDDVKLRGIRVSLTEVEAQLLALPEVAAATVVLAGGDGQPRALRAAVVPRGPFDEERALAALRRTLPEISVPVSILALERMPRTPSGKLDRGAIGALIAQAV